MEQPDTKTGDWALEWEIVGWVGGRGFDDGLGEGLGISDSLSLDMVMMSGGVVVVVIARSRDVVEELEKAKSRERGGSKKRG